MVTTVDDYKDARSQTTLGSGFDGVVRVVVGKSYGTGVLLYDGRAVLTAAHLVSGAALESISIVFETPEGKQENSVSTVAVHPAFDRVENNNDLAIAWLSNDAPAGAERYGLYRHADEIGQLFTMAGYGLPGSGALGTLAQVGGEKVRLKANNQFDADASTLKNWLAGSMNWTPTAGTQLVADFDNGTTTQDALGRLINEFDVGLGKDEGLIAPGDSGGPAFIHGQVAGIASYTSNLKNGDVVPDVDATSNSSFGEIAAWQRVSYHQQWIDQSLRAQYPDTPSKIADVKLSVSEGDDGVSYAYFFLKFIGGRSAVDELLSVDYTTRDGTAKAHEDYVPISGTLHFYPNENQALIPVEIIGDAQIEMDETFYLEVTNPVGISFGDSIAKLVAVRTILDDDAIALL